MKTVEVNLSDIRENPNNPRLIKDDKFKKLVQSIKDFPQMLAIRPIVVNADMTVLGGNMRLKACKEAGLKKVPILVANDLTDAQQKEFIIKDNVGFGEWDWDTLANEWNVEELTEWGLDIPNFEIEEVLEAVEDDFDVPEGGIKTDIVLGDLFEIGGHRLLCGDSTDSDSVAKLMNGEKADMVFTDPPYGMKLDTDYSGMQGNGRKGKKYDKVKGDNEDFSPLLITSIFENFDCEEIFLWGVDYYFDIIPNFKDGSLIVWDKTLQTNGDSGYNSEFELLWSKTPHKKEVIHFNWFRYFGLSSQDIKTREHPTQKPLQVITPYIERHSKENNIIVDVFGGSGTTMVAAHQLKRKCYGMELDSKYCEVIVTRMIKLDNTLTIKRNGVDETQKWLDKLA